MISSHASHTRPIEKKTFLPHNSFLVDHNLPSSLVNRLKDLFPDSTRSRILSFATSPDSEIWRYAKDNGSHVLTRDADFEIFSNRYGFPPKVILIRKQKCPPKQIEDLIRKKLTIINKFLEDTEHGCLILRD